MLSVAGHLTIFLTRTRGPFWSIRPARILLIAVFGTQTIATFIAVYGLFMTPLGWTWAAAVWGYALIWFLVSDRIKLFAYRILDPVKTRRTRPKGTRSSVMCEVGRRAERRWLRRRADTGGRVRSPTTGWPTCCVPCGCRRPEHGHTTSQEHVVGAVESVGRGYPGHAGVHGGPGQDSIPAATTNSWERTPARGLAQAEAALLDFQDHFFAQADRSLLIVFRGSTRPVRTARSRRHERSDPRVSMCTAQAALGDRAGSRYRGATRRRCRTRAHGVSTGPARRSAHRRVHPELLSPRSAVLDSDDIWQRRIATSTNGSAASPTTGPSSSDAPQPVQG